MDLNEFAKEVHALAVEKGFYDPEPSDAELIAAIHSEISEAFEEWRAGRPMVWHRCKSNAPAEIVVCERCAKCYYREKGSVTDCPDYDAKPEGIAVELIDVVLRVLDAAVAWEVTLSDIHVVDLSRVSSVPELINILHRYVIIIDNARACSHDHCIIESALSSPISLIFLWLRSNDLDPEALLREKHEYNKTRPYRHGGKRV